MRVTSAKVIAATVLAGFAASGATAGPKFDVETAQALPVGTTEAEAVAALGKPKLKVSRPDGTYILQWRRTGLLSGKMEISMLLFDKDGRLLKQAAVESK